MGTSKKILKGQPFSLLVLFKIRIYEVLNKVSNIFDLIISLPKIIIISLKKIIKHKGIQKFTILFILNLILKESIDTILTPIIMLKFGLIPSFIFTMIIYILIGIFTVKVYDYYKNDFAMLEALKESEFKNNKFNTQNKLVRFIIKKSKGNRKLLILLLTFKNPGLSVLYMRKGYYIYNGFKEKNIKYYFLLNILIMNICFNGLLYFGITTWKPLWNLLKQGFSF